MRRRHPTFSLRLARDMLALVLGLGLIAVLVLMPAIGQSTITWRGDFETDDFSQWEYGVQEKESSRSNIVAAPLRQGRYAARFEVRSGDNNVAGSGVGERTEALIPSNTTDGSEGHEAYWAWSTYFPSDFAAPMGAWNVFTQFHHTGSTGQSNIHFDVRDMANIGMRVMGGDFAAAARKDFALAPLAKGRWYDFVFHVKWSSDPNVGFVEMWVNGSKVVPKTMTPTLYYGQGVYLKQGYYRAAYDGTTVVYHDGMRRGSSYDEVAAEFPSSSQPAPFAVTSSISTGSMLSGTVQWSASPSGATASSVAFKVDGEVVGTDATAPYTMALDTTKLTNGTYDFSVDATATDGRSATATASATVSNQIVTPLSVQENLKDGQTVRGLIAWTATTSGKTVARVEFLVNGKSVATDSTSPYAIGFDTTSLADGAYSFAVRATATDGSTATASASVNVANSAPNPPAIPPPSGFSVSQNVWDGLRLTGVFDWIATPSGRNVTNVAFFVDEGKVATDGHAPYDTAVDARKLSDGTHTLKVVARADDGSTASAVASVVVGAEIAPSEPPKPGLAVSQSVAAGQTLSGSVSWTASPTGPAVDSVEFLIDGRVSWTERFAPYVFNGDGGQLDTRTLSNGSHTLEVRAHATDGTSARATADVSVSNGSQPELASTIRDGQALSGRVAWEVDPRGLAVATLDFYIDGTLMWTERLSPYVYNGDGGLLDTRTLSNGSHTLEVRAYASDGSSAKASADVSVVNSVEATLVSSIKDGQTISGLVTWEVRPPDFEVSTMEFYIDSNLMWTERLAPYVYGGDDRQLDTRTLTRGTHALEVRATGTDGRTRVLKLSVTVA